MVAHLQRNIKKTAHNLIGQYLVFGAVGKHFGLLNEQDALNLRNYLLDNG